MKRILVTYATMAGSTAEIAQKIGEELSACGAQVVVLPLRDVNDLAGYDGVVVGAPLILGAHRGAVQFLRKHRKKFQRIPLSVFLTGMRLTKLDDMTAAGLPVWVDEKLAQPPSVPGRLNFKERYATISNYFGPVMRAARPANAAIFGGRMEYGRLPWWAVLFAMVVVQAPAGDKRNWEAIRAWAQTVI